VTGDLTIRNETHEISFPATIVEEGARGLLIDALFEIDRTRWGIVFDSGSVFFDLGDKVIKDGITFGFSLVFQLEGTAVGLTASVLTGRAMVGLFVRLRLKGSRVMRRRRRIRRGGLWYMCRTA